MKPNTKQIPYTYHLEDLEFKESEWMGKDKKLKPTTVKEECKLCNKPIIDKDDWHGEGYCVKPTPIKEPALYKGIGVVLSKKGRKIIDKTVKQDTEDYKNLEKIYLGEKITSILLRQIIDDDIKRTYQELLSLIQSELDRVRWENFEELEEIKEMEASDEAHRTEEGYCCACGYDMAVMKEKIDKNLSQYKKELIKKIRKLAKKWGKGTIDGERIVPIDQVIKEIRGESDK